MTRDERIAEAVRLYAEGWSLARVGAHLGVDFSTVGKWLKEVGVVARPRGRSLEERGDNIAALVAGGMSMCAVAELFGTNSGTVAHYAARRGVRSSFRRGRPRRAVTP